MKLATETNTENKQEKMTVKSFLDAYLKKAAVISAGRKKADANDLIRKCYEKANRKGLCDASLLKAAEKEEKELKKKASKFGLKTKLNYLSDADHKADVAEGVVGTMAKAGGLSVVTAASGLLLMGMESPLVGEVVGKSLSYYQVSTVKELAVIGGPVLAYAAGKAAVKTTKAVTGALTKSRTVEEKKKAQEYADIKHMQLALKTLRRAIEHPTLDKAAACVSTITNDKKVANAVMSSELGVSDSQVTATNVNTATVSRCAAMIAANNVR